MPFTIESNDTAAVPARQSVWYDTDIAIVVAGVGGTGALTGCAVTAQGTPDMTLAVAAGTIQPSAGAASVAVTGGNVTITTAHATLPRIDLVTASAAGVKTVTAGTAATSPKPPALPSGHIGLAMVDVPAADTAIQTAQVTDKRTTVFASTAAGSADPIADMFGTPDTAFEFATSSLTGLTSEGSGATVDANTTVPGDLYLKPGTGWSGYSYTPAAMPWTAITKLDSFSGRSNYAGSGLFVGVATLGAFEILGVGNGSVVGLEIQKFSSLTVYVSSPAAVAFASTFPYAVVPMYLAIVANSSTSVDFYASRDGRLWVGLLLAHNPAFTVAKVGLVGKLDGAANATAAYDFLRIWNSAKTFQT